MLLADTLLRTRNPGAPPDNGVFLRYLVVVLVWPSRGFSLSKLLEVTRRRAFRALRLLLGAGSPGLVG